MRLKKIIVILSILVILLFPLFFLNEGLKAKLLVENSFEDAENDKTNLKTTGFWDLTGTPIYIDGNSDWDTIVTEPWCTGAGTWNDPYIIENVIIDGENSGSCIEIRNSDVFYIIRNCTLSNSGSSSDDAGIFVYRTDNGQLLNNTCNSNNNYGIYLDDCRNHTIYKNRLNNNHLTGIRLLNSIDNNISRNVANFNLNFRGIELYQSDDNLVLENIANGNYWSGIDFYDSADNIVKDNIALDNQFGIYIMNSDNNKIWKNTFKDNTEEGILVAGSDYANIFQNVINNSNIGLSFHPGQNCTILSNKISFCDYGIHIYDGNYNDFSENSIFNNTLGLYFERGIGNTDFYKNYFKGNTIHAIDNSTNNNWDNGVIGNYWDNYTGTDTNDDGRGDTPYNIPGTAGSIDHFPIFGDPFIVPNQIHIDDTGVDGYKWIWVTTRAWGSGSGTSLDPYIIKDLTFDAGNAGDCILIENSDVYFIIENCTCINFSNHPKTGIKLENTDNGQLIDNYCSSIWEGYGISLQYSDNNTISGNRVNNSVYGIFLQNSHLNDIMNNILFDNGCGITLEYSIDNNIINNTVIDNNYGIYSFKGDSNDIIGNKISQINQYGIHLEYGYNDTLYKNEITYCDHGIHIWDTTFEDIKENVIKKNDYGIFVDGGEDINFLGNLIDDNDYGIHLEEGSFQNTNNTIIYNNTISNSYFLGIEINSDGVLFYYNRFIENPIHAIDDGLNNEWDNGVIGNYWDDYVGIDANDDGIGDTPYNITGTAGSQDHYPIMEFRYDVQDGEQDIFGYNIFILVGIISLFLILIIKKRDRK